MYNNPHKIVYLVYRSFYVSFLSRVDRCILYPLLYLHGAFALSSPRYAFGGWWLVVVGVCMRGIEVTG